MSTTTITLTCAQSGTSYTTNLNGALGAIDTCHSGTTAPTTNVVQGKQWLDTSSGDMILKIYDGTSWLTLLDLTAGVMKAVSAVTADSLATARTVTVSGDATGSFTYDGSANSSLVITDVYPHAELNGSATEVFSASTMNAATVDLGDWTVTETTGVLYFATGGVSKMKLDASGNITCVGNITAYGTM